MFAKLIRMLCSHNPSGLRRRVARPPVVPRLEFLEERALPSTFTVTNLQDSGAGSLREAISLANGNPGADEITFALGVGHAAQTITLTSGQLRITDSVAITGPGATKLTISGNHASRVFDIAVGTSSTITGVGVANGYMAEQMFFKEAYGGAVYNAGALTLSDVVVSQNRLFAQYANGYGGGIYNSGSLLLLRSTVSGNEVLGDVGISAGGGIFNAGTATIQDSTIADNRAPREPSGYAWGGGVANGSDGTLSVVRSTVSGNFVDGDGGGLSNEGAATISDSTISSNTSVYYGGALINHNMLTVTRSTITANSASFRNGGGIVNWGGPVHMGNTILAGNSAYPMNWGGPDLVGTIGSLGYNLIGDTTGGDGFASTDLLNVSPKLGTLQHNGGPNQTVALLAGSPAINAGHTDTAGLPAYDQRGAGYYRVSGSRIDIGAFEVQQATPGTPSLSISDAKVREGRSGTKLLVFIVNLSAASSQPVTVNFATADGSAIACSDYVAQSGKLTFAPGETSKKISIVVNGDRDVEADEIFFVKLTDAVGAVLADGQGVGRILNDD